MSLDAFSAPGRFWRGNLHTHSTASDGALPPDEVCRRYRAAGYDFLCLSDHFVGAFDFPLTDTRSHRDAEFTTLIGAEVHAGRLANGEIWHLLAVGLPFDFARPDVPGFEAGPSCESGPALASRCRAAGAFVAIAHPQWYGLGAEEAALIEAAHAVEIYNHASHVTTDRADGTAVWDALLSRGRRLSGCATDDAHFFDPDHFGGWVMVKAEANTPEALLEALKAGRYYATQGPQLQALAIDDDTLVVATSPVRHLVALGAAAASVQIRPTAGLMLTRARVPLAPFAAGGWVRLVAVDDAGRRAWSNPVFLSESA